MVKGVQVFETIVNGILAINVQAKDPVLLVEALNVLRPVSCLINVDFVKFVETMK